LRGRVARRHGRRSRAAGIQLAQPRPSRWFAGAAPVRTDVEVRPAAPQLGRRAGPHALATLEAVDACVVDALLSFLRPPRKTVRAVRDSRPLLAETRLERRTDAGRRGAIILAHRARLDARRVAIAAQLLLELECLGGALPALDVVDPRRLEARVAAHAGEGKGSRQEDDDRRENAHRGEPGNRLPLLRLEPVPGGGREDRGGPLLNK